MNNQFLVVGIEFRKSKAGKAYKMLHLSSQFTDCKYGVGSRTQVEYISDSVCPSDIAVGQTVELTFGRGFDGKAYCNGVHIVAGDVPTVEVKK